MPDTPVSVVGPAAHFQPQTYLAVVSFLVSFTYVRDRSQPYPAARWRRSRPLLTCRERTGAELESVLGASPREFESRILRVSEQAQRRAGTRRVPALLIF
ncbi:MAG: hypothetical protein JWL97_4186 [Gemmatimonadales bacterium]|jgi:hypothetical protein|nr:hypothetical protein [Gemmatimonadales bacterium]